MKRFLAFALLLVPTVAVATDYPFPQQQQPGQIRVIEPSADAKSGSTTGPATDVEILALVEALNVKDSLRASIEAATPLVKQSYNDLLNKTMREQGVRLPPEQIEALSKRITEKHAKLKTAMFDWMLKEYVKRHKATYTQAETLQILNFMKSGVGRKYVQNDSRIWAGILTEANTQFVSLIPGAVAQAFREAGALR